MIDYGDFLIKLKITFSFINCI